MPTVQELEALKTELIAYLKAKTLAQDWHAVSDAANDIREIDAQLKILTQGKTNYLSQ